MADKLCGLNKTPQAVQNCSTCPHVRKCWSLYTNAGRKVSSQNVAINILICRLKLRIDPEYTTRNLLTILRPGIVNLVSNACQNAPHGQTDFDTMLADMQSAMVEYLMVDYNIGDFLVATSYLFHPTRGYLVRWAKWHVSKMQRFSKTHELRGMMQPDEDRYDDIADDIEDRQPVQQESYDSIEFEPEDTTDLVEVLKEMIEDGATLNHREYRVFTYCLQNANESNASRHIDGLHLKLAELIGVSRPRITRLYRRAQEKLHNKLAAETDLNDQI